jgi:hypothetical protein
MRRPDCRCASSTAWIRNALAHQLDQFDQFDQFEAAGPLEKNVNDGDIEPRTPPIRWPRWQL